FYHARNAWRHEKKGMIPIEFQVVLVIILRRVMNERIVNKIIRREEVRFSEINGIGGVKRMGSHNVANRRGRLIGVVVRSVVGADFARELPVRRAGADSNKSRNAQRAK